MKLLRLIRSVDPAVGGPATHLRDSTRLLQAQGHCITVVSLDPAGSTFPGWEGISLLCLGRSGLSHYGYTPALRIWLRENLPDYDCLFIHGIWQYPSLCGRAAALAADKPYFVYLHGMLDPWFKRTYRWKHLKKWCYWPWGDYRVLRDAQAVFFTSEEERLLARQSFWLYRCREQVLPYGPSFSPAILEEGKAAFASAFPQLKNRPFILFMGRIHEKKGVDLLLKAWSEFRQQKPEGPDLVLAGPLQQHSLQQYFPVQQRGFHYLGALSSPEKWGALAAAEAFILPSHQENFGLAVAESLAVGTPVLISTQVNIWREIKADGAGLVERDTPAGTLRLLMRWESLDLEEKKRIAMRARSCYESHFAAEKAVEALLAFLTKELTLS